VNLRALLLITLLGSALAPAQTTGGTLTGIVTDPSGGVVPNVSVRALHTTTGTLITGTTSATGNYLIPNLPVGQYEVTIEQPGFKAYKRQNLTLAATQVSRLDIKLDVGSTSDSVTVSAESTLLQTESGTLTHNITPTELQNLPVMPVTGFIRDPFAVLRTIPGVMYDPLATFGGTRVNGLPNSALQFRLDGEVLGQSFGAITTRTQPSPEAIQEVAVQTSNLSAEYGSVSGALVNVTMKSGTNQFHGGIYDYAVNEVLNAEDAGIHRKNRIRRHDYGFNIGGPITIPGVYNGKNKSFFFFNFEQYRDRQLVQNFTAPTVPVDAYRNGDFSNLINLSGNTGLRIAASGSIAAHDYIDPTGARVLAGTLFDPATTRTITCNSAVSQDCANGTLVTIRSPYPGNLIPRSVMDPVALAVQSKYIPTAIGPNATAGVAINNYYAPYRTSRTTQTPSIKIDHSLSSLSRLSFTYTENRTVSPLAVPDGYPEPISTNIGTYETGPSYRLNFDSTIKPTLIFHLGLGWSQFEFNNNSLTLDYDAAADIGLRGATLNRNFPRFNTAPITAPALGGLGAIGPATQAASPERRPSLTTNVTYIRGKHSYRTGADWRQDMYPSLTFSNAAGSYNFSTQGVTWLPALQGLTFTGNSTIGFNYANFLLGGVTSASLSTPISYRRSKRQYGVFVQDSWRARRNLTFEYGVRWDYGSYAREDYGRVGNLSLTVPNPSAGGRPGGLIYEATCNCTFAQNYPYAIAPRFGFAFTLDRKTVLRGGASIAYNSVGGNVGGSAQNSASTITPAPGDAAFALRDGMPAYVRPVWPVYDAGLGQNPGAVIAAPTMVDRNAGRPSRVYQWNFTLQRELLRNLVVEASYVGNRGYWQPATALQDFNAVSPAILTAKGFTIGNTDDATLLNTLVRNLTPTQRATLASRGVSTAPYTGFPDSQTVLQAIKPFPQYNTAIQPSAPLGHSWYDALQLNLTKRLSHGLQIIANYTWSKNLEWTSSPDVFNWNMGKDLSTLNFPNQLRLTFLYEVQRPPATLPILGNKFVANAVKGWSIAVNNTYQSAAYFSRPANAAANPISRWLGRGTGGAQLKRNSDGSFMNPWSVDWNDLNGVHHTDPIDINCRCFDPEKTIALNPAAWENAPDAVFPAQNQLLPWFRNPRRVAEAANLARNFRFGRENRFNLQVRMEFQNPLNRRQTPFPTVAGSFTNPTYNTTSDGRYTSGFGSFGNLRANTGSYGSQRSGQLIARFQF
jgi:hypothetical protein